MTVSKLFNEDKAQYSAEKHRISEYKPYYFSGRESL